MGNGVAGHRPANAFTPDFLEDMSHRDAPQSESEVQWAGPYVVRETVSGFGVFHEWERSAGEATPGDAPLGTFELREHALLAAAMFPAIGREPLFRLNPQDHPDGYAVETIFGEKWVQLAGRLRYFETEVPRALHFAEALVRSPQALASLLEAAGATTLERVGKILARRLYVAGWRPRSPGAAAPSMR
jgi:hypothetical protein